MATPDLCRDCGSPWTTDGACVECYALESAALWAVILAGTKRPAAPKEE